MKYLKCINSIFSSFHFADRIQENKDNSGVKTGTGKVQRKDENHAWSTFSMLIIDLDLSKTDFTYYYDAASLNGW